MTGFDTAAHRRVVLDAWAASPARFREDANAEEELALGAYRDRLVVELAQNAADAALRTGRAGRLLLALEDRDGVPTLVAANTGSAVDAAGVESLSTLRASTKRDGPSVGRFGVGFAAVLAVTDAPELLSRNAAVGWSAARTRELLADIPALAEEVTCRQGHVPVLRLPFDAAGRQPPADYDTAVLLPLRDASAVELVTRLLAAVDDALMLTLPGLSRVEIRTAERSRVLTSRREGLSVIVTDGPVSTRWHVVDRSGSLDQGLVADRPVEERRRAGWAITWAVPVRDGAASPLPGTIAPVAHAPTPTDDELDLPALLVATFPLDSSRRRVAPGPLRDFLVDAAAGAYADLVRQLAGDPALGPEGGALALVPGPVPSGELDAELRRGILARLADTPFLPAADGSRRLRPSEALLLRGAGEPLVEALAPVLADLVPAGWAVSSLARLGARTRTVAEVVEELADLRRDPVWWHRLYAALAGVDAEALRGLPVPLADGRLVRDPRDVLLPDEVDVTALAVLGLRVAHPDAAHPLLERLGARRAGPAAVLAHPAVRALIGSLWDADDAERAAVAEAVLTLLAAAGPLAGELPWLADLPLRDADGELAPAAELLLPGAPLARVLEPGALGVVAADLVERYGERTLRAAGVLDTFAVVRDVDLPLDPETADHDLDGEAEWLAAVAAGLPRGRGPADPARFGAPDLVTELVAVRDLDLVAAGSWPAALRMLSTPPLRAAVTEPVRVLRGDGRGVDAPSYTAWWLRGHPVLDGARPRDLRLPGSDPRLAGLWDTAPVGLDHEFAVALGVRVGLVEVLAAPDGPAELTARLADPARDLSCRQLVAVYAELATVEPDRVPAVEMVRVPSGSGTAVVAADSVVVVDAPDLTPVLTGRHLLPAPPSYAPALAEVLVLPLAGEEVAAPVRSLGTVVRVPEVAHRALAGAPRSCPQHYVEHDRLLVRGPGGDVEVDWRWVDGELHAATPDGLGAGLAWAAGVWGRRWLVAAAVADPAHLADLLFADEFAE